MASTELPQSVRVTKLRIKVLSVPHPQYQVAALAGIHPSTMSMYVKGDKPILDKHLVALCDLFGCEPDEIVGWRDVNGFYQ
jgi:DNA-binding Xre family transcriptional regulator